MPIINTKIPPPIVAMITAAVIWTLSSQLSFVPVVELPSAVRFSLIVIFLVIGLGFDFMALLRFFKAKTTVNPLKPEKATQLVTNGVYRVSRNPMYVGLMFLLLAWGMFLATPWVLFGVALFMAYVTAFQIRPEENILLELFGSDFEKYKQNVRMWL